MGISRSNQPSSIRPFPMRRNSPSSAHEYYYDCQANVLCVPSNTGGEATHECAHAVIHHVTSYGHLLDTIFASQRRLLVRYLTEHCHGIQLSTIKFPLPTTTAHPLIASYQRLHRLLDYLERPLITDSAHEAVRLLNQCRPLLGIRSVCLEPTRSERVGMECEINGKLDVLSGYAVNECIACAIEGYLDIDIDVQHNALVLMLMDALKIGRAVPFTRRTYHRLVNTCIAAAELALWPAVGMYAAPRHDCSWSRIDPGVRLYHIVGAVSRLGLLDGVSGFARYQGAICKALGWSTPAAQLRLALRSRNILQARRKMFRSRGHMLAGLFMPPERRRMFRMLDILFERSELVLNVGDFISARGDDGGFTILGRSLWRAFVHSLMHESNPLGTLPERHWVRAISREMGEEVLRQVVAIMLPDLNW